MNFTHNRYFLTKCLVLATSQEVGLKDILFLCIKKATLTMLISVLNNIVNKWCEENSIRTDAHFGFRNNFSTTDAVFALHTLI